MAGGEVTDPSATLPTETLGRYRLLKAVGRGGMAQVYLGEVSGPQGFKKRVALKVMLPGMATSSEMEEMFFKEARVAAEFSHPNIIQVYDFGEIDGRYYIAMEYAEGMTLRGLLKRTHKQGRSLSPTVVATIGAQLASALAYLHDRTAPDGSSTSVIHRDISPENVFLTHEGFVKLIDFGIAKVGGSDGFTQTGSFSGKPSYMSPEQAQGAVLDCQSDIFSLGSTLWECVAQRKLFQGELLELLSAIAHQSAAPIEEEVPSTPAELASAIMAMLARDPRSRPGAAKVRKSLERFLLAQDVSGPEAELAKALRECTSTSASVDPSAVGGYIDLEIAGVIGSEVGDVAEGVVKTSPVATPAPVTRGAAPGLSARDVEFAPGSGLTPALELDWTRSESVDESMLPTDLVAVVKVRRAAVSVPEVPTVPEARPSQSDVGGSQPRPVVAPGAPPGVAPRVANPPARPAGNPGGPPALGRGPVRPPVVNVIATKPIAAPTPVAQPARKLPRWIPLPIVGVVVLGLITWRWGTEPAPPPTAALVVIAPAQPTPPPQPPTTLAPPPVLTIDLAIESVPTGARIELDGKALTTPSPTRVSITKAASHEVHASLEGFVTASRVVAANSEATALRFELVPERRIRISSKPSATVTARDGSVVGVTPCAVPESLIQAGVTLVHEGYVPAAVALKEGSKAPLAIVLRPAAFVTVTTDPPGAALVIDGVDTGTVSPAAKLPVVAGVAHTLVVRRKSYEEVKEKIKAINKGRSSSVQITLHNKKLDWLQSSLADANSRLAKLKTSSTFTTGTGSQIAELNDQVESLRASIESLKTELK